MRYLSLVRVCTSRAGTFGVLVENAVAFLLTLENPWQANQADVSCIPPGSYVCRRVASPTFGETFEVTGVPGRTHILFHSGNTPADTHGCILTGQAFDPVGGTEGITGSRAAFRELMTRMAGAQAFDLSVSWASPGDIQTPN